MKKISTSLNVIAMVAITWYLCTYYGVLNNWWSLLVVAGATAICAVVLPILSKRFKPFWSLTSTGLTLLVLQTLTGILNLSVNAKFWYLAGTILVIAVITELLAYGPGVIHVGELVLDCVISLAFAWLIVMFAHPITTVTYLLVGYILVLVLDFDFEFSLKGTSDSDKKDTTSDKKDTTVE